MTTTNGPRAVGGRPPAATAHANAAIPEPDLSVVPPMLVQRILAQHSGREDYRYDTDVVAAAMRGVRTTVRTVGTRTDICFERPDDRRRVAARLAAAATGAPIEYHVSKALRSALSRWEERRIPSLSLAVVRRLGLDPLRLLALCASFQGQRWGEGGAAVWYSGDEEGLACGMFLLETGPGARTRYECPGRIVVPALPDTAVAAIAAAVAATTTPLRDVLSHPAFDAHELRVASISTDERETVIGITREPPIRIAELAASWTRQLASAR